MVRAREGLVEREGKSRGTQGPQSDRLRMGLATGLVLL